MAGRDSTYSQQGVTDDNVSDASLFRTAKLRPEFPAIGFASRDVARSWATEFMLRYNENRHSGIRYLPLNSSMSAKTRQFWLLGSSSVSRPNIPVQHAGQVALETGLRSKL
jgi:hypothetical protein